MRPVGIKSASDKDLFDLSIAISDALRSLDVEVERMRQEMTKTTLIHWDGLLSGSVPSPTPAPTQSVDVDAEVTRRVREIEAEVADQHPLLSSIRREPMYGSMQMALERQAARRGGRYADPRASLLMLCSTAGALSLWRHYRRTSTSPNPPGANDWRVAITAVETLMRLERMGVPVAAAFNDQHQPMGPWVPWDWLSRLKAWLRMAERSARKPHRDEFVIEREACKCFARAMYVHFDHIVAPTLVERFGDLIGYQSEKITRTYLKDWLHEFETGALA